MAMILMVVSSAEALEPSEGYIQVKGGKVWYQVVGSGKGTPLLVVHGGPGAPSYYLKPLSALGDDRPVIFYDQLGAGHSDTTSDTTLWTEDRFLDELNQVRQTLGLKEVDLYGHSWGSILVLDYLLSHPEGVKSCIFAGPALSIPRWAHDADSLLKTLPDSTQRVIKENERAGTTDSPEFQNAMTQYYDLYLARKQPWSADIDSSLSLMNQGLYNYMNGPSEFTITGTLHGYDHTNRLHEIKIPTLYIAGQFDEATPATVKYYHSLTPNSEMVIVPDAAHLAMQDNPAFYIKALRDFLRKVDGQ
jgi:proline-specific peptidase